MSTRLREGLVILPFALWWPFPICNNPVSCLLYFGQRGKKNVNSDFIKSMSLSIKRQKSHLRETAEYVYGVLI